MTTGPDGCAVGWSKVYDRALEAVVWARMELLVVGIKT